MTLTLPLQLLDGLGGHTCKLLGLYPLFLKTMSDEDDEVCRNAIYGMGLLMANGVPDSQRSELRCLSSVDLWYPIL